MLDARTSEVGAAAQHHASPNACILSFKYIHVPQVHSVHIWYHRVCKGAGQAHRPIQRCAPLNGRAHTNKHERAGACNHTRADGGPVRPAGEPSQAMKSTTYNSAPKHTQMPRLRGERLSASSLCRAAAGQVVCGSPSPQCTRLQVRRVNAP